MPNNDAAALSSPEQLSLRQPTEEEVNRERIALVRKVSARLLAILIFVLLALVGITFTPVFGVAPPVMAPVVLLVGAIGGFVSIQRRIKTLSSTDLSLIAGSVNYLLLAPLVGGILASILYLLFLSELVTGDIFPRFKPPAVMGAQISLMDLFNYTGKVPTDYAKLLFWSFLGGYSERFVVDIIGNFEKVEKQ